MIRYSEEPTRTLNQEVYLNRYTLVTPDTFDSDYGNPAQSLHLKEKDARKFNPFSWWCCTTRALEVFVSQSSLEKLVKNKGRIFEEFGEK